MEAGTDPVSDIVRFEAVGHVGVITLNRPSARNAVNAAMVRGITAALARLESDDDLWVGVLTGEPPDFCAGADLKEVAAGMSDGLVTDSGGFAGFVRSVRRKPIIAAVEGSALGGGAELVIGSDIVVAARQARIGLPEVRRGMIAGAGGAFRLPRKIPVNVAMRCILTGQPITATEAHHFGLVNEVCSEGDALTTAMEIARVITESAPMAVRVARRLVLETALASEADAWSLSQAARDELDSSDDRREGLAAFLEGREPRWTGC